MSLPPAVTPRRTGPRSCATASRALAGALCALIVLLTAAAAGAAPPAIELVETRPVETAIGDPSLRSASTVWLEMIRSARRTLDLEHFYLSDWPGEPLREVLDAIGAAGRRGVRVRIVLDARMHRTYPRPADSLGRLPGIEVRRLDMARIAGGVQHAKFMRVDGREVFVGSQNLDWRALKHIHELGVRVRDERVAEVFGRVFELDWAAADTSGGDPLPALRAGLGAPAGPPAPIAVALGRGDTARVWPLASPRGFLPDSTRWDLPAIVRLLDSARSEAALQLLQYSPESRGERDATLDDALRRAAARGVRVRLLISDWVVGGRGFAALRSLAGVPGIEVRISSLPEWSGGYIPFARVDHSKYLVVDGGRLWIGTSNWEPGYFTGSRNLGLVLEHPGLAAGARRVFESGWAAPSALTLEAAEVRGPRPHGEETPPGRRRYGG